MRIALCLAGLTGGMKKNGGDTQIPIGHWIFAL